MINKNKIPIKTTNFVFLSNKNQNNKIEFEKNKNENTTSKNQLLKNNFGLAKKSKNLQLKNPIENKRVKHTQTNVEIKIIHQFFLKKTDKILYFFSSLFLLIFFFTGLDDNFSIYYIYSNNI